MGSMFSIASHVSNKSLPVLQIYYVASSPWPCSSMYAVERGGGVAQVKPSRFPSGADGMQKNAL